MFCSECGDKLNLNAKFCGKCGNNLNKNNLLESFLSKLNQSKILIFISANKILLVLVLAIIYSIYTPYIVLKLILLVTILALIINRLVVKKRNSHINQNILINYQYSIFILIFTVFFTYIYGNNIHAEGDYAGKYIDYLRKAKVTYINATNLANAAINNNSAEVELTYPALLESMKNLDIAYTEYRSVFVPLHIIPVATCINDMNAALQDYSNAAINYKNDPVTSNYDALSDLADNQLAPHIQDLNGFIASGKCTTAFKSSSDFGEQYFKQISENFRKLRKSFVKFFAKSAQTVAAPPIEPTPAVQALEEKSASNESVQPNEINSSGSPDQLSKSPKSEMMEKLDLSRANRESFADWTEEDMVKDVNILSHPITQADNDALLENEKFYETADCSGSGCLMEKSIFDAAKLLRDGKAKDAYEALGIKSPGN